MSEELEKKSELKASTEITKETEAAPAPSLHPWHVRLNEEFSPEAVEDCIVNEKNDRLLTITISKTYLPAVAEFFKTNPDFQMNYCRNVSGSDLETHLEVAYYLYSLPLRHEVCLKVKTDREVSECPSLTPIWATSNWNEREIYDLLGVQFIGHPDLRRIMMPDDWVGHPLRKDYVSIDPEV